MQRIYDKDGKCICVLCADFVPDKNAVAQNAHNTRHLENMTITERQAGHVETSVNVNRHVQDGECT